jgi:proteasome activator subunit 4
MFVPEKLEIPFRRVTRLLTLCGASDMGGDNCLEQGKDLTLDWTLLFKRMKHDYLYSENTLANPISFYGLACATRSFFDPRVRVAVAKKILPYFDTTDAPAASRAVSLLMLLSPTEPAPESSLDCQPRNLVPTYLHLLSRLFRTQLAIGALVELFAKLTKSHLVCKHVPFGAYGIFEELQSREIFAAIARLTQIDDHDFSDSFTGSRLTKDDQNKVAERAAEWIVFSLSPLGLRQGNCMFSGLKTFIASIAVLYHPYSTVQEKLVFVTMLLRFLAERFCWRSNKEQSAELVPPPERRITDELRRSFVLLMRGPVLSGCFSLSEHVRSNCCLAARSLADLEPSLVVPTALQRFYFSQDDQVDGKAVEFSTSLLVVLCSIMAREKGLRCHLPNLMNLALSGINAHRPNLTAASCQFIRLAICDPALLYLSFAKPGNSKSPAAAISWISSETKRLKDGGSLVDLDYRKQLTDEEEVDLLQSAFSGVQDFVSRFIGYVFQFASDAYRSDFNARESIDRNTFEEDSNAAETDVLDTAEACFLSMQPERVEEVMVRLRDRLSSDPIPGAKHLIGALVAYTMRANPERGVEIFAASLLECTRHEIVEFWSEPRPDCFDLLSEDNNLCWYAIGLCRFVIGSGPELLSFKDEVLEISRFAREKCGYRAYGLSAMLSDGMITGLTQTSPTAFVVPCGDQPGHDSQNCMVTTTIKWHVPSPSEIQAACEMFVSEATWLEEVVRGLIDQRSSVKGAEAHTTWGRSLIGALQYLSRLICSLSSLFDPGYVPASGDSDDSYKNHADDAECVSARVQDFHRILEPDAPLYAQIHNRRSAIGGLASEVQACLLRLEGQHSDCLCEVWNLYYVLVCDVGQCHAHYSNDCYHEKCERWARHLTAEGAVPSPPPAVRLLLMDRYHAVLQGFATSYRHMGDLERKVLRDLPEGCSSPYESVRKAALSVVYSSVVMVAGSAQLFLPRMLNKLSDLIIKSEKIEKSEKSKKREQREKSEEKENSEKSETYRGIQAAVESLVENIWLWKRYCPSKTPDLLTLLIKAAKIEPAKMPSIARLAKEGIKRMGVPDLGDRTTFPGDGIVEAIRPAGDYLDMAHEGREHQRRGRDEVLGRLQELGIQILKETKDPQLCSLSIRALIGQGFDKNAPPPDEHISFLAKNSVAGDSKTRYRCIGMLEGLVQNFLSGIRFGNDLEEYIRTQGCGGSGRAVVEPIADADYTERYLAGFAVRGDGEVLGDDVFVDPTCQGSLVWPAKFDGQLSNAKLSIDDPQTAQVAKHIGSFFTKTWVERFLSPLQLEEESFEDGTAPPVLVINIALLSHAFRLMEFGASAVKLEDMEDLFRTALGDGKRIGQHIAASTLLLALMRSPLSRAFRSRVLEIAEPLLISILEDKISLAGETWDGCLHWLLRNYDPRRFPGLVRYVSSLQLTDLDSALLSHAKLDTLCAFLTCQGWRFRQEKEVVSMLLRAMETVLSASIASAVGTTLASVFIPRFHDSWPNVHTLIAKNRDAGPLGIRPFETIPDMRNMVTAVFKTVSTLREKYAIPYPEYYNAAIAALAVISGMLNSNQSGALVDMIHPIIEQLFLMLDARIPKNREELKKRATGALGGLCRLPFREDEPAVLLKAIVEKSESQPLSHRIAAMGMIRELYLRRLFTNTPEEQRVVLRAVSNKIQDPSAIIQSMAAETLSDLISRSRLDVAEPIILEVLQPSVLALKDAKNPNTIRLVATRRLGALVSAYPHVTERLDWEVEAIQSLILETGHTTRGQSKKVAIIALRNFEETRRPQWRVVSKVS